MHVCPEWTAELDLYLDGELAADDRRRLERHLDACEGCRSGLMRREETKASLRSLACATTCSSEFLASVEARLTEASPAPARPARWGRVAAALLALMGGGAVFWAGSWGAHSGGTSAQASGAFDEAEGPAPVVVDASARWHARAVPVEVTGPEPDAVQAWFADKVAFPVLPPEFGSRAHLIGGRLSNVERSEAAFLVYDVEGTKLSVMVFDAGDTPMPRSAALREGGLYLRDANGLTVAVEERGGLGYTYTSRLSEGAMSELVAVAFTP